MVTWPSLFRYDIDINIYVDYNLFVMPASPSVNEWCSVPIAVQFGARMSLLACHNLNMNAMGKITVEDHLMYCTSVILTARFME